LGSKIILSKLSQTPLHALASFCRSGLSAGRAFQLQEGKFNGHPYHRHHRRQSSQGELLAQDRPRAPASLKLEVITPHGISNFSQDEEAAPPADWLAFREKLQKSHGVLFVTPEYNRSIPGVLKNAIDVGSRPYGKSSFLGKPVGIISNSPGPLGGVSAAKHRHRRCLRRQGPAHQGIAAEGVAAVHRRLRRLRRKAEPVRPV
jgi:NAD(P)H-dependent FMN reductase